MLKDYFEKKFRDDILKIKLDLRPDRMRNASVFGLDPTTVFWGGRNWENVSIDLVKVDESDREKFALSMFGITLIDLNMHANFRDYYARFRKLTNYPKFGWTGMGPHFENPKKIIAIPLDRGLIKEEKIRAEIDDFVDLFIQSSKEFFKKEIPEIDYKEFAIKLINDRDMKKDSCSTSIVDEILDRLFKNLV